MNMNNKWEEEAAVATDYHSVEVKRGREFILRLTTGADIFLAIQKFAIERNIEFAKIHTAFMGAFQPTKYLVWIPDINDLKNWQCETTATCEKLSGILALGGIIHPRINSKGIIEPFPAIHFVSGGAWDCPVFGGHLEVGTLVKGVFECFITEITGIKNLVPSNDIKGEKYPRNWYEKII